MQMHRKILGLALGASLGLMSCSDVDEVNECQDACSDANTACVNSCTEETCPTDCQALLVSCVDDCG